MIQNKLNNYLCAFYEKWIASVYSGILNIILFRKMEFLHQTNINCKKKSFVQINVLVNLEIFKLNLTNN